MNKILFLIFLLLNVTNIRAQGKWVLKSEKDDIRIYTGDVAGSPIKAVKVVCELNATASQLVAVLLDVKNCTEWLDHTKSCTLLKQVSPSELYYYSEVSLPWPAENRDFVAHLIVHQNPETKVVIVDGPVVQGYVPVRPGIVRVNNSKGYWVITPVANNRVKVEYTLQTDPGGSIPVWLINSFATVSPMKSFQNLKKELKKPVYQTPGLSFIKN